MVMFYEALLFNQVTFQEINIQQSNINRAHLVNCKKKLTESLHEKNYFSKNIKVLSNKPALQNTVRVLDVRLLQDTLVS